MKLTLVNGPAQEPVALDDMKLYLRLDGDAEDAIIAAMIAAARHTVEAATSLALGAQTWRMRIIAWPAHGVLATPIGPLRRVEAVRRVSRDGETETLASDGFHVDDGLGAVVALGHPPVVARGGRFEIDVALGYDAETAPAPAPLLLAVRSLVAHWFDNRGEAPASPGGAMMPDAVRVLLAPWRPMRLA